MLKIFFELLTSGVIGQVGEELNEAYRAKLQADTDEKKMETQITIERLQHQQRLLLEEQKRWLTAWIRPALALPVVIYVWKILVWDTVLGLGITSNPGDTVNWIVGVIIGAYFLTRPFEKR